MLRPKRKMAYPVAHIASIAVLLLVMSGSTHGFGHCTGGHCSKAGMRYKHLGRTGLKVSVLSYGAWVTFGNQIDDDTALDIMQTSFDHGINFFDNAEVYASGLAEEMMGRVLKRGNWTREDLVISTKIFWGGQRGARGVNQVGLSRKHIIEGLRASLKRLQLEYVDVVFCHRPDPHTPIEETVRAMNFVIDKGMAFYWGTSEWPADMIREAMGIADRLGLIGPTVEQPQYNMLHRKRFEVEYATLYRDTGLGTTIWSSLAYGILTGKYNDGVPAGSRFALESFDSVKKSVLDGGRYGSWDGIVSKMKELGKLAKELSCTQAQLAIAWTIKNPAVSTCILGGTKVAQLRENLQALSVVDKLTPEIMERIEQILDNKPAAAFDWTTH